MTGALYVDTAVTAEIGTLCGHSCDSRYGDTIREHSCDRDTVLGDSCDAGTVWEHGSNRDMPHSAAADHTRVDLRGSAAK